MQYIPRFVYNYICTQLIADWWNSNHFCLHINIAIDLNFAWSTTTIGTCILQHRYYMSVDVLHNQFTSQVPTYLVGSRCVISGTYMYDIQVSSPNFFQVLLYERKAGNNRSNMSSSHFCKFVYMCFYVSYHTTTLLSSVFVFGKSKSNNHQ